MKWINCGWVVLGSCLFLGCASESEDVVQEPVVDEVARTFKTMRQMTAEPVFINPMLASLCRGADKSEVEVARKTVGPHAHTTVLIYMNEVAAKAFEAKAVPYPVGSVIVKEKEAMSYRDGDGFVSGKNGVGGMVKREAGYDAAHGDWEYFYFEDVASIESGTIASCVDCHANAAKKDYVFGGWAGKKEPYRH